MCEKKYISELFSHYPDSVLVVNRYDEVLYANPSGMRFLCRMQDAGGYLPMVLRVLEGNHPAISMHDIAGNEIILEIKCSTVVWDGRAAKILVLSDRTEEKRHQREIEKLVYRDELTGLCNRRGLERQINELILHAKSLGRNVNAFFIDVNGLKKINDTLGHGIGDRALLETSEVVRQGFGESAICARIGGDEFAVFQLADQEQLYQTEIERIEDGLAELNRRVNRLYCLSLSIGVSQYSPGEKFDLRKLLQQADTNMYRAKGKSDVIRLSKKQGGLQRSFVRFVAAFSDKNPEIEGACA